MICMSIRLVYDTRKLQKYIKMQGNWVLRDQNHVLCYFYQKYGTWVANTAPILSTNWFCWFRKQFGWFASQYDLFMTPGSCKNTSKCKEIELWGVKIMLYAIFTRNMGLRWPILHQSWVQIGFVDLENNLDDLHVKKTCLWPVSYTHLTLPTILLV